MTSDTYFLMENYMLSCMVDSAHDKEHIYRVLYQALEIGKTENDVDYDVLIGALGIARTLLYKGKVSDPLYSLLPNGLVSDGTDDTEPSFFQEYKYKLESVYSNFYTTKGAEIARQRQSIARYGCMFLLRKRRAFSSLAVNNIFTTVWILPSVDCQ